MQDIQDLILDAWDRLRLLLEKDPAKLAKRLARRRAALMRRTPRVWCLALRANDTRITRGLGMDPGPEGQFRHEVPLDTRWVRDLCAPVRIDPPGQTLAEVADKLGTTKIGLNWARVKGTFRTHYVRGLGNYWGRPVPLLYTDRELDPAARNFVSPGDDPVWSCTTGYLTTHLPPDFEQFVERVPVRYPRGRRYQEDLLDLSDDAADSSGSYRRARRCPRMPTPPPDVVWYKWKGDQYIGYDWRGAARNPRIRETYERHERLKARLRAWRKAHPRPRLSKAAGSLEFRGWRWLCPTCQRPVKMIYYPFPPINLLAGLVDLPGVDESLPPAAPGRFACDACVRLARFSRMSRGGWGDVIAYLTAGLLYGREVPRPQWLTPDRKNRHAHRKYIPPADRLRRRADVLERLLRGRSMPRIAAELGLSYNQVKCHVRTLYREHGVHARPALAAALGHPSVASRPSPRRDEVHRRLAEGQSIARIACEMNIRPETAKDYARDMRRAATWHGLPAREF